MRCRHCAMPMGLMWSWCGGGLRRIRGSANAFIVSGGGVWGQLFSEGCSGIDSYGAGGRQ